MTTASYRFATSLGLGFTFVLYVSIAQAQINSYEIHYEWKQIDYNFPDDVDRNQLIQNGEFQQINVIPNGLKISQDQVFLFTPRFLPGVPSTFNVIKYKKPAFGSIFNRRAGPKLTPFPSYEMQEIGNCFALQNVASAELDPYNRLWLVDIGRVDILGPTPRNLCNAKLVIIDLNNQNMLDRVYEFPEEVASTTSNTLKDIQVECSSREDCFAYISDLNATSAIVVYNYRNSDSWRVTHSSMQPEADKGNITIDGTTAAVPFGISGMGLTPKQKTNYATLYYSKIAGDHIYRVSTAVLKNSRRFKSNPTLDDSEVQDLGQKSSSQSDSSAMDNRGRWFFASLPESALYSVDTSGNPGSLRLTRIVGNSRDMQWIDGFDFDGAGYLTFITNRFQQFVTGKINPSEVNYRIIRVKTDSNSYHTG